jgi:hypothetical protein
LALEGGVEIKLRLLKLDQDFLIVKTSFLKICLDPDMIETNRDPHPKLQFRIKLRKREERESERKR